MILPETNEKGAAHLAQRLRQAIEALAIPHIGSKIGDTVTCSLGVATVIPHSFSSPAELIANADKALYKAKQEGRNRVMVFS